MKVVMTVHTNDENGVLAAGEIIDVRDELAAEWIEKQWAVALVQEQKSNSEIQTPEDDQMPMETAVRRRAKPYTT